MREIKFRVFYKRTNVMRDWDWLRERSDIIPYLEDEEDDFFSKAMQYTGLKDKNGKEIYEGDIVRSYNEFGEAFAVLSVVEYDEQYAKYRGVDIECLDYEEVIGNIYENPELLEGDQ